MTVPRKGGRSIEPTKKVENMPDHVFWRLGKAGLLAAFFLMFVWVLFANGSGGKAAKGNPDSPGNRVDALEIRIFEKGETHQMPPAIFMHDRHTSTLKDRDCSACHEETDEGAEAALAFEFKGTAELSSEAAKKRYHADCIGCHKDRAGQFEKTGPLVENCRGCHQPPSDVRPQRKQISFDRSLHFKHESAEPITYQPEKSDENCGACHHVYDEQAEKLIYKEGEEGSCRYCHKPQRIDDTRSFKNAAHDDCVNCHRRFKEDDIKAGPVECRGCHSAEGLAEIERIRDVPRLDRGQPDARIMADWLAAAGESGEMPAQYMKAAAFDHLQHENAAADTCRKCHHESLEACRACHKSKGAEEGGFVSLERAMHDMDSERSCTGCHKDQNTAGQCAGCHAQMPETRFAGLDCEACHALGAERLKPLPLGDEKKNAIAGSAVKARPDRIRTVAEDRIPEELEIDVMVDEYQAAQMPHRKIVNTLVDKIGDNSLAAVFHKEAQTLCSGCHHNSPPGLNPPKCTSCHTAAAKAPPGSDRPGLKAAYHGQCIECHKQMGLEEPAATDCKACHEERNENG